MKIEEGLPDPLGATWDGRGTNFALFSANATKVEVCIFDSFDGKETSRTELPEYTDQSFHGFLPDVGPGTFTDFACMARTSRNRGTDLMRRSFCLIPMRVRTQVPSNGTPPSSDQNEIGRRRNV